MTSYETKGIRDLIAALQQIVRDHGTDLRIDVTVNDRSGDGSKIEDPNPNTIDVYGPDGKPVAEVCVDCCETSVGLLEAINRIPNHAQRKTRQHSPR